MTKVVTEQGLAWLSGAFQAELLLEFDIAIWCLPG